MTVQEYAREFSETVLDAKGLREHCIAITFGGSSTSWCHYHSIKKFSLDFGMPSLMYHYQRATEYQQVKHLLPPGTRGINGVHWVCLHEIAHGFIRVHESGNHAHDRVFQAALSNLFAAFPFLPQGMPNLELSAYEANLLAAQNTERGKLERRVDDLKRELILGSRVQWEHRRLRYVGAVIEIGPKIVRAITPANRVWKLSWTSINFCDEEMYRDWSKPVSPNQVDF